METVSSVLACLPHGTGVIWSAMSSALDLSPTSPSQPEEAPYTYTRSIPVESVYDVIVVGGGPAGCAAAIQAGRLGARVLLLEQTGALGGMGTQALVSQWSHTGNGNELVVGGLILEWMRKLLAEGGLPPGVSEASWVRHNRGFGFNAEHLRRLLDCECLEAGVEVRFFSTVMDCEVRTPGKSLAGVVVHSAEGLSYVPGQRFIDASGNAVLAELAGAPSWRAGRDTPKIMPPTLCSLVGNVDFDRFDRHRMQQPAVEQAIADGFFSQPDRHVPGLFRTGQSWGILNAGHLFKTDALSEKSLSHAMVWGRQLAEEYTAFYRKYLKGCENAVNLGTAPLLGVRESRRVQGEYRLNYDDYRARRHFPDQIAVYCKQVDIHVYDTSPEEYERYEKEFTADDLVGEGESYGIPYGTLVPRGWDNLWAAGRCLSSDLKVNGAVRDQPACAMMGQAAGAAAVQSLRSDVVASRIDTAQLVETLRENGANLPQQGLSPVMTRTEA